MTKSNKVVEILIDQTEYYPVANIYTDIEDYMREMDFYVNCNVSQEFVEEYTAAHKAFYSVNDRLNKLYDVLRTDDESGTLDSITRAQLVRDILNEKE